MHEGVKRSDTPSKDHIDQINDNVRRWIDKHLSNLNSTAIRRPTQMFIAIQIELLKRNDLTSNEKIIASLISYYEEFPINHSLISRITGISRPTVVKSIQNLLEKKVIVAVNDHYHSALSSLTPQLHYIPSVKRMQDLRLNPNLNPKEPQNIDLELKQLLDLAFPPKR